MGYSNQYIQWLGSTNNPVMNLLRKFRENDRKISEMTSLLKELERCDVLEELQPYIGQWKPRKPENLKWTHFMKAYHIWDGPREFGIWQSSMIILLRALQWGRGGMQYALTLSVIAETTCCLVGKEKCCSCILAWEENFAVSSACIFVILSFGIYGRYSAWKELIINSPWRDCSLIIPTLENYWKKLTKNVRNDGRKIIFSLPKQPNYKKDQMWLLLLKKRLSLTECFPPFLSIVSAFCCQFSGPCSLSLPALGRPHYLMVCFNFLMFFWTFRCNLYSSPNSGKTTNTGCVQQCSWICLVIYMTFSSFALECLILITVF